MNQIIIECIAIVKTQGNHCPATVKPGNLKFIFIPINGLSVQGKTFYKNNLDKRVYSWWEKMIYVNVAA